MDGRNNLHEIRFILKLLFIAKLFIGTLPTATPTGSCPGDTSMANHCYNIKIDSLELMNTYQNYTDDTSAAKECTLFCRSIEMNKFKSYSWSIVNRVMNIRRCFCSNDATAFDGMITCPSDYSDCNGDSCMSSIMIARETKYAFVNLKVIATDIVPAELPTNITIDVDPVTNPTYTMEFGDGIVASFCPQKIQTHTYLLPGMYQIKLIGSSLATVPVIAKKNITVVGLIDTGFNCPSPLVFEVGQPIQCPLQIYSGSSASCTLTISYEGAGQIYHKVFEASDAITYTLEMQASGAPFSMTELEDTIFIYPYLKADHDSYLLSLDMTVNTAGYLHIYIFRPPCNESAPYCPTNEKCMANCDPRPRLDCAVQQDFRCIAPSTTSYFNTLPPRILVSDTIVMVQKSTGTPSRISLLSRRFQMKAGDVIGISSYLDGSEIEYRRILNTQPHVHYVKRKNFVPVIGNALVTVADAIEAPYIKARFSSPSIVDFEVTPNQERNVVLHAKTENVLNQIISTVTVPVQERIIGLQISVPESFNINGYEINTALTASTVKDAGKPVMYYWTVTKDGAMIYNDTTENVASTTFVPAALGIYRLDVKAVNLLGTNETNVYFGIHRKIVYLTLEKPNGEIRFLAEKDKQIEFKVAVMGGSNVTIYADYGDGTPIESRFIEDTGDAPVNLIFGHTFKGCARATVQFSATSFVGTNVSDSFPLEVVCPITGLKIDTNPPSSTDGIIYVKRGTVVYVDVSMESGSFALYKMTWDLNLIDTLSRVDIVFPKTERFSKILLDEKLHNASISISNDLSSETVDLKILVEACSVSGLMIDASSMENSPTYITLGMEYAIDVEFAPQGAEDCPPTDCVYKDWVIGKIEADGVYGITMRVQETKAIPKLILPPKSLGIDVYRISLTELCSKGSRVTVYNAYIDVSQSPLVGAIEGGYYRAIPFKILDSKGNLTYYDFTLDASASYDPDITHASLNTLKIEWYCRYLSNATSISESRLARNGDPTDIYRGDVCKHSELKQFPSDKDLDETRSEILKLNSAMLLEGIDYEFKVKIIKDTRESFFSQTLSIQTGVPPNIGSKCLRNCQFKLNQQEKFITTTTCDMCGNRSPMYTWSLLDENSNPSVLDKDNSSLVTSTGWDKPGFILNPNVLENDKVYYIRLVSQFPQERSKSTFIIKKRTSNLPKGGYCDLNIRNGTVMKDLFQVVCREWKTQDTPLKYTVQVDNGQKTEVSVSSSFGEYVRNWYHGSNPQSPLDTFPVGLEENDFRVNVSIRIINKYGGYTAVPIMIAYVYPFPLPTFEVTSDIILDGEEDQPSSLDKFLDTLKCIENGSNKTSSITNCIIAVISVINNMRTKVELVEWQSIFTEVVFKLIKRAFQAKVTVLDDFKEVGEALNSVSETKEYLTIDILMYLTTNLITYSETLSEVFQASDGANALDQVVKGAFATVSNVILANEAIIKEPLASADGNGILAFEYQQLVNKSRKINLNCQTVWENLNKVTFQTRVVGERSVSVKTESFEGSIIKLNFHDLENISIADSSSNSASGYTLPDLATLIEAFGEQATGGVLATAALYDNNPFSWDVGSSNEIGSQVTSLEFHTANYELIEVQNLENPIVVTILNAPNKLVKLEARLYYPGEFMVLQQKIKNPDDGLLVRFSTKDEFKTLFTIYLQYGKAPSFTEYDMMVNVSSSDIGNINFTSSSLQSNRFYRFIDPYTMLINDFRSMKYSDGVNSTLFIGVKYSGDTPEPLYEGNPLTYDEIETPRPLNLTMNVFSPVCRYWDATNEVWSTEGLTIDLENTDFEVTVCKTYHLSAFGGFQVKPEPIPALSFDMLKNGFVLLLTVLIILLLYGLAMIYARRSDKKDLQKIGICPLADNNPAHRYKYQITVFTGMRKNAGTDSNVFFIATGEFGETKVKHLEDPKRDTFTKNSADAFVFTTEKDIGELSHIRIWHDNSKGGWYLRNVAINDLQRDKVYNFLCSRWLAADEDDGLVERLLPVSGPEELSDFSYLLTAKARQDLSDSHLWFSIYARPPGSNFTRTQRLSCCLVLLMTTMMASALFYRMTPKPTPATQNEVNGIKFTWSQVYVSVITALITVPINVLIVTLFRSARLKGEPKKSVEDIQIQIDDQVIGVEAEDPVQESENVKKKKKKKEPFTLPYWTTYIAWVLVFISVVTSSVMVIIYGMVFGNKTSLDWLATIIISFSQDIIITQPIKVFALAVFVAAVVKKIEDVHQDNFQTKNKRLTTDEEWLHGNSDPNRVGVDLDFKSVRPPDLIKLRQIRELRLNEKKMFGISREILVYTFYVFIAMSIAYSLREEIGYTQTSSLNELFKLKNMVDPTKKTPFTKVYSYNQFWPWMEKVLLPVLFPSPWYSEIGAPKKTETFPGRLFLGDINSKLVNGVRLRQLRIKPGNTLSK